MSTIGTPAPFFIRPTMVNVTVTLPPTVPNTLTITNYDDIVYSNQTTPPPVSSRTFIWTHLIGDLDNWAKQGIAGSKETFRWNNEPLSTPNLPWPPTTTYTGAYNSSVVSNIVKTLPSVNTIWTPDWYTYPQGSINRYNSKYWNQYYFNTMANFAITNAGTATFTYSPIQYNQTFEVSNLGGPVEGVTVPGLSTQYLAYTYFFYLATGSGIKFTANKCLYSMNKLHAYYIYQCWLQNSTAASAVENGTNVDASDRVAAFDAMVATLFAANLATYMDYSLLLPSGYFVLPDQDYINVNFWIPLVTAYTRNGADVSAPTEQDKVWAVCAYLVGMLPFTGAPPNPPQPNILNNVCVATNAYPYPILGDPGNTVYLASKPYEYYVQAATNLSVADNILDPLVSSIMADTNLNVNAVVNLSQWNSLGGWACEIPSYYGSTTIGTDPKPALTTTYGETLTSTWWTGTGGILGINDCTSPSTYFDIDSTFL